MSVLNILPVKLLLEVKGYLLFSIRSSSRCCLAAKFRNLSSETGWSSVSYFHCSMSALETWESPILLTDPRRPSAPRDEATGAVKPLRRPADTADVRPPPPPKSFVLSATFPASCDGLRELRCLSLESILSKLSGIFPTNSSWDSSDTSLISLSSSISIRSFSPSSDLASDLTESPNRRLLRLLLELRTTFPILASDCLPNFNSNLDRRSMFCRTVIMVRWLSFTTLTNRLTSNSSAGGIITDSSMISGEQVPTSILNCNLNPQLPDFWRKLTEERSVAHSNDQASSKIRFCFFSSCTTETSSLSLISLLPLLLDVPLRSSLFLLNKSQVISFGSRSRPLITCSSPSFTQSSRQTLSSTCNTSIKARDPITFSRAVRPLVTGVPLTVKMIPPTLNRFIGWELANRP
mmetsp:Transcript_13668/g.31175  ORF Transcript_13668/g.31175 Transcript_13668/m.31175 type:complete len:406 (-) Transcript_13668:1765-2982(-)